MPKNSTVTVIEPELAPAPPALAVAVSRRTPQGMNRAGRPKGSKNKVTVQIKTALSMAAQGLGGTARLVKWAQEDKKNEYAFWVYIYPRLLPHEHTGADGVQLPASIQFLIQKAPDSDAVE